jgi:hypothetical protein
MRAVLLVLAVASPSLAQFAQPTGSSTIVPANTSPTAHPWYVKPEHGQWMICVKSYSGATAREFAEGLAREIRETYQVPAYLFERGAMERQMERERHGAELARKRAAEAKIEADWNAVQARARAEAAAKGIEFIESKREVKASTVLIEDQYAVLIGGWADMATARREMEKVRKWAPPANTKLMDTQFITRDSGGQRSGELAHVNPFQAGMVVPNPVAPKVADAESEAETKFVLKLNENEEYSVLKIQKPWTICVKLYTPPVDLKGKTEQRSVMAKLFNPKPDTMLASAGYARDLAKALRSMAVSKENPHGPYESYVLHTKYGSMVCVGQFNTADDPKLLEMQQKLGALKFQVDTRGKADINATQVRLFDHLYAMRVKP